MWQRRDMLPADWSRVVELLTAWVKARDATTVAATPADARRHAEMASDRARAERRAELERARVDTDAEIERLDRGEPVDPDPPRRGGWLRRSPTP